MKSILANIKPWLRQTSTIHGLQAIAGTFVAAAGAYAEGHHAAAAVILAGGVTGGAVGLILPDNTQAAADVRDASAKFVTDIEGKDQQRATVDAIAGMTKVLTDLSAKVTPAPVAPAASPVATVPASA